MSEWLNQFENHQIHDNIRSAITPSLEIRSSSEDLTPGAIEKIDRVIFVLSELKRRLKQTDPLLIPLQPLNNLQNPLSKITDQLSSFQNNKDEVHIQNAHNHLENVLVHLSQIPSPGTTDDMEAIREAAIGLRRSAAQHVRHIDEEARVSFGKLLELKQTVESLHANVEQMREELDELLQGMKQEFDESEERRQDNYSAKEEERNNSSASLLAEKKQEWNEIIENIKTEYDKLHNRVHENEESRQEHYLAKEEERNNSSASLLAEKKQEWNEIIEVRQTEYKELYESVIKKIEDLETEFRSATKTILDEMEARKNEAERVVGVITDTGMVGGYQRIANNEKWSALLWRLVAFISLCSLVWFAIKLFNVTLSKDFEVTPTLTLTRVFVALAIGILAGYAARQSDKHERAQRQHRKMELELASIMPYLHAFPDDEAREIKKDLAMKMFAQQDSVGFKGPRKTENATMNLLKMALESIQSLVGKQ